MAWNSYSLGEIKNAMTRKRNVSENATGSAAAPARAKKASTTTHSRRTKATAAEPETTAAPAVDPTPSAVEATATVQSASQATHEQIARLAYSYWEARGHQGGSPEEDWARAEQELRGQA
jgi:hypothetical protein